MHLLGTCTCRPTISSNLVRLLALLLLGLALLQSTSCSPLDPHPPDPTSVSWFEGWYLRITTDAELSDPGTPPSLGLIAGYIPRGHAAWNSSLVELILEQPREARASGSSDPTVTSVTGLQFNVTVGSRGQPVSSWPARQAPPNFTLTAGEGPQLEWRMAGNSCSIAARVGKASLTVECTGPPLLWAGDGWGPEGLMADLPTRLVGLHWFVHSLGTPVRLTLEQDGKPPITGRGLAHIEKNWGLGFPGGWVWVQGVALDKGQGGQPQAAFTVAGGKIPAPWIPDVWLLGVRIANISWDFRPWDTLFYTQLAPCASPLLPNSTFNITAVQPLMGREARIEVSADPRSFSPITCPTQEGFQTYSVESYSATATVRLFRWELNTKGEKEWLQKRLVGSATVAAAALEFGGSRRCEGQPEVDALEAVV